MMSSGKQPYHTDTHTLYHPHNGQSPIYSSMLETTFPGHFAHGTFSDIRVEGSLAHNSVSLHY